MNIWRTLNAPFVRWRFTVATDAVWFAHRARQKWRIPGLHYPWSVKRSQLSHKRFWIENA